MSYPQLNPFGQTCLLVAVARAAPVLATASSNGGQNASPSATDAAKLPPATNQPSSPKAAAYYHFAVGHLYADLAGTYGNRSDYANKAIDNYRLAMKEDPSAGFLVED